MKKIKKGKPRPSKPKRRARPKQVPKSKKPAGDFTSSPFATPFDFVAPSESAAGLLSRASSALRSGNPLQALTICREALDADPNNADVFNLAGVASFQCGLAEDALGLLQTAVAYAPSNAEAQTNLGNVLTSLGKMADAEEAYRAAMQADPEYAEVFFNFGRLMEMRGEPVQAASAYEKALKNAPDHIFAKQGLGNVLKSLGQLNKAKATYKAVLNQNPAMPEVHTNLAAVLQELSDFEGAITHCRQAIELAPDLFEAHYNLGIALQEIGRYEEAIVAYERVLSSEPKHAAAALNIAYGLQQMGRLDDAAKAYERTIEIDPDFSKAYANLADLRLQQGEPAAALAVCDAFLKRHPQDTNMLAFKAVALWDNGDDGSARGLVDFDRFLKVIRIVSPKGYENLTSFNSALAEHVENHPTLTYAPQSHATRKGRHSGELLREPKGPIADLEKAILEAAEGYQKDVGRDPAHPFLAAPPDRLMLSVWGVVMRASGHQIPHIHPAAWLSGVYYAKVPSIVREDSDDKAGWIEFGRPPAHFHNNVTPATRSIRPEPGIMVLFPSYFYHHTVPFETDETRISIAFDLMPK